MKKKIIGIFVIMLLISINVQGVQNTNKEIVNITTIENIESSVLNRLHQNQEVYTETENNPNIPVQTFTAECIGDTVSIFDLGQSNTYYGLAIKDQWINEELYVSDYYNSLINIYGFDIWTGDIEFKNTIDISGVLSYPLDIAYRYYPDDGGTSFLFVLTSNDENQDSMVDPRLYRFNLDDISKVAYVELSAYIGNNAVYGLACDDEFVYISYNTDSILDDNLRNQSGIIRFKAVSPANFNVAKNGNAKIFIMPDSGYSESTGLAYMNLDGYSYLWGTFCNFKRYNNWGDQIYVADANTGRGIFAIPGWLRNISGDGWSPYINTHYPDDVKGITYGKLHLWAITDDNLIYKIKVQGNYNTPKQDGFVYRNLKFSIKSEAKENMILENNLAHVITIPPDSSSLSGINNQKIYPEGKNWGDITSTHSFSPIIKNYFIPGGHLTNQVYYKIYYPDEEVTAGDTVLTSVSGNIWTSAYKYFIYPHLCNYNGNPSLDYTQDDDLYGINSHISIYDRSYHKIINDIENEYGSDMAYTENPYWIGQNLIEFIKENWFYNENGYNGNRRYAWKNLANLLHDNTYYQNMSCTPSTFTLIGLSRYLNIPSRWIGQSSNKVWDKWTCDNNNNGFLDEGEYAEDGSYHRWAQLWMGDIYGWQRFDPTPFRNPYPPQQAPQWRLMWQGRIQWPVCISQVGLGVQEDFINQDDNQEYNTVCKYAEKNKWTNTGGWAEWSNARFINLEHASILKDELSVTWNLEGDWDHPCPWTAEPENLLICLRKDNQEYILKKVDPHDLTTTVDGCIYLRLWSI
jgi:hypothetical protein